jgi:hypothetical protein
MASGSRQITPGAFFFFSVIRTSFWHCRKNVLTALQYIPLIKQEARSDGPLSGNEYG